MTDIGGTPSYQNAGNPGDLSITGKKATLHQRNFNGNSSRHMNTQTKQIHAPSNAETVVRATSAAALTVAGGAIGGPLGAAAGGIVGAVVGGIVWGAIKD
jgi:hypothetical protein